MTSRLLPLLLLVACSNELKLAPGDPPEMETPDPVTVRTRPVCGNGVQEAGEECDDGNADDQDGCNAQCQTPCAAGEITIVGCAAGETFRDDVERWSECQQRWVDGTSTRTTVTCRTPQGDLYRAGVCRNGACLNVLPPVGGERVCSRACSTTNDCAEGQVCVGTWSESAEAHEEPLLWRRAAGLHEQDSGICLPAVGGTEGDRCGTCGQGLGCNGVTGRDDLFVCMPNCEGDEDCPAGAFCGDAFDTVTECITGKSCFYGVSAPLGARVSLQQQCDRGRALYIEQVVENCALGCARLYGCGLSVQVGGMAVDEATCVQSCLEDQQYAKAWCRAEAVCDNQGRCDDYRFAGTRYCTQDCSDADCPDGYVCQRFVEPRGFWCVAERRDVLVDPPPFEAVVQRQFPDPVCPDDVDTTCTFESECDRDCVSSTGCGEVPGAGLCDGEGRLLFCERHRIVSIDCDARGLACGFDAAFVRFDCLAGAAGDDASPDGGAE